MTTPNGKLQPGDLSDPLSGLDGRVVEAILAAVESSDDAGFASALEAISDPRARAVAESMRSDRDALRGLETGRAPAGLLAAAIDRALDGDLADNLESIDTSGVAALEAGATSSLSGPPVSGVEAYREPVVARIWRRRREVGLMAAAVLVFVSGMAIVAGVRSIGSVVRSTGPVASETDGTAGVGAGADEAADSVAIAEAWPSESPIDPPVVSESTPEQASAWLALMPDPGTGEVLDSVFDAAPLLGSDRIVFYARSGSTTNTAAVMDVLTAQRIGVDHAFGIRGELVEDRLGAFGIPEPTQPVIASAEGGLDTIVLAARSGWVAEVRRTPAALAALRRRLEDAGLTVEIRVLSKPVEVGADLTVTADEVLWWSGPASRWQRTAPVPIVIDSLPDR